MAGEPLRHIHNREDISGSGSAIYSATLGVFIPSGGSKWIIEAPYVLMAAVQHQVNLGWVVQVYKPRRPCRTC